MKGYDRLCPEKTYHIKEERPKINSVVVLIPPLIAETVLILNVDYLVK